MMPKHLRELIVRELKDKDRFSLLDLQVIGLFETPSIYEIMNDHLTTVLIVYLISELCQTILYENWRMFYKRYMVVLNYE